MGMLDIDVQSMLYAYDQKQKSNNDAGKTNTDNESRADDLNTASTKDPALRAELQRLHEKNESDERLKVVEKLESYHANRDNESGECSYDVDNPEVQKCLAETLFNSLNVKNVQKIIFINNRESIRKGLSKEVSTAGYAKNVAKGQMSTITIPTQLLRYVQQEIGGLSTRMTQNDLMTGFLYWYFGKPEDVVFGSEEMNNKMQEILDNLDLNASPAKFNRLNYNTSTTVLDKLDSLSDQIDLISSLMSTNTRDSIELKTKSDKMYIALCYNILNMLAFAPPIMPGEQPEDIDILANGTVWDLMSGIETAYDYYKTKNGRELYKSKIRKTVNNQFNYTQQPVSFGQTSDANNDSNAYNDYDDNDYYGSDDGDYEEVDTSEFDDMSDIIIKDNMDGLYSTDDRTLDEIRFENNKRKMLHEKLSKLDTN